MRARRPSILRVLASLAVLAVAAVVIAVASSRSNTDTAQAASASPVPLPPANLVGAQTLSDGWVRTRDVQETGRGGGVRTAFRGPRVRVAVPQVADPRASRDSYRSGIWWYRRQVAVPAAQAGAGWALRFDSVRRTARVYVDGREVGRSSDPYAPFQVPLPDTAAGRTVSVVVRVDGRKPKDTPEGWWNWAGIVRPVHLVPVGRLSTQDPGVQGQARCGGPDECRTSVLVRAPVQNRTGTALGGRMRVTVRSPDGDEVGRSETPVPVVPPGGVVPVASTIEVPDGRLWSPADPVLYRTTVEILAADGRVEQTTVRDVGLRTVTVSGGRLLLNGRVLRLRGASIQEDLPGRGAAMSDADVDQVVNDLRDARANVTRAHYTLDERLLSALDRAGILVWSQAPVYQSDDRLATAGGQAAARRTNERAVVASRNHPSVLVHSVANELTPTPDDTPGSKAYLDGARADTPSLDPTVPVAVDLRSYPGFAPQSTFAAFPALGLNVYFGWYPGRDGHSTADFASFAPFLDATRAAYPRSALTITEMGAEAVRPGPVTRKGTFAFQAAYLSRLMDVIDSRKDLSGALWWTLREFAVKPRWVGGAPRRIARRDGIHRKALLTYGGKRKPAWAVARTRLDGTRWAAGAPPVAGLAGR